METGGGLARFLVRAFSPPLAAVQLVLFVFNTPVFDPLSVRNRTAFSFGQHSVSEPLFHTHTDCLTMHRIQRADLITDFATPYRVTSEHLALKARAPWKDALTSLLEEAKDGK